MNGYNLSRDWFNFRFENPDRCRAIHSELYLFIVDQWNRLGQKEKFGLPTNKTMEVLQIGSYNTYKKTLNDLIEFGFLKVVKESKNQYSSKIIALSKNDKANDKTLDKATDEASDKATDTIIKQINNKTKEQINIRFIEFWNLYNKKVDKTKSMKAFSRLTENEIDLVFLHVPKYILSTPDVKYRKNPLTYINGKCWEDEVEQSIKTNNSLSPLADVTW